MSEKRKIDGPTILTVDGQYFSYLTPSENVTLNSIARGLANTCRFGGQCERYYSVAEHSVWVSRLVPTHLAIWGLMHDAAEAFIGDMPKPLKETLSDYKQLEKYVEGPILAVFGLHGPMPPEIKTADMIMLGTEQKQIMKNQDEWRWAAPPNDDIALQCLAPADAYHLFMARAHELGLFEVRNVPI